MRDDARSTNKCRPAFGVVVRSSRVGLLLVLATATPIWTAQPQTSSQGHHVGIFRHQQDVGHLSFDRRLIVTQMGVEYWARATENGRGGTLKGQERGSQRCNASVRSVNGKLIVGAMTCETYANGDKVARSVAFDIQFNGTTWIQNASGSALRFNRER